MTNPSKDGGPYYAKDGMVWKDSIATQIDGGTSYTLGFPVCTMHPAVGDDGAETVAALMNAGHNATDPRTQQEGES
jgi:hypothetical protein